MNALQEWWRTLVRGPEARAMLRRAGIDPHRYWLLMDLFDMLSVRREVMNQLGREGTALKLAAWIYFVLAAVMSVVLLMTGTPVGQYFGLFLGMTGFFLTTVLFSEAGNSLVNPVESLVLAHQPVDGATYTAAKVSHLFRIVVYMVAGLDGLPALAGLFISGAPWYYPIAHFGAALVLGVLIALSCCAVFGWLIRFMPAARLKRIGQILELLPWMTLMFAGQLERVVGRALHNMKVTITPSTQIAIAIAVPAVGAMLLVSGLRSLSADYLVRVSAIVHGGSGKRKAMTRRGWLGRIAGAMAGGPAGRAGFDFTARMMRRDWQFRRHLIPFAPSLLMSGGFLVRGIRTSPFGGGPFAAAHVLPHLFGGFMLMVALVITQGTDHQGKWVFLTAPAGAFRPFARGVHALLWMQSVALPNAILFPVVAWFWGLGDAALFILYSMAVGSAYLGLDLRAVDAVPFSKPVQVQRGSEMLPVMLLGVVVISVIVAIQHFLLFRWRPAVALAAAVFAGLAWVFTRSSLENFETAMKYSLMVASDPAPMFRELESEGNES